ncbi:MAG: 16S rRNA (cytosine(1402)-N(4))-methyltransferase RsmH [bacterium]|nr:16S rRNA (cytosine(1402)-N(4))-methyltransferase RsmH [bacterium]
MHIPVLLSEVINYLDPKPNQNFIDCTMGGAGHSVEILKRTGPEGKLLGIDWNKEALRCSRKNLVEFSERAVLVQGNFANLKKIVETEKFNCAQGILLDLGMSSTELESSGRGFSFLKNEPLDMRYGESGESAAEILNSRSASKLAKIFREYGEEKQAWKIAKTIAQARVQREIKTTGDLVKIIGGTTRESPSPSNSPSGRGRIHPATKVFQALRIAVNHELENLEKALPQALEILEPGGRIVVISFHSLEDRIVKSFFRTESRGCLCGPEIPICVCKHQKQLKILTKKPVKPKLKEINQNPAARSARLRVAVKFFGLMQKGD